MGNYVSSKYKMGREHTYFHRMLYGVSKAITEYIGYGSPYESVRKVYSINIVYFELGQGKDYVYHGKTEFIGEHAPHDTLKLSIRQNEKFFGIKDKEIKKKDSWRSISRILYLASKRLRQNSHHTTRRMDRISEDGLHQIKCDSRWLTRSSWTLTSRCPI